MKTMFGYASLHQFGWISYHRYCVLAYKPHWNTIGYGVPRRKRVRGFLQIRLESSGNSLLLHWPAIWRWHDDIVIAVLIPQEFFHFFLLLLLLCLPRSHTSQILFLVLRFLGQLQHCRQPVAVSFYPAFKWVLGARWSCFPMQTEVFWLLAFFIIYETTPLFRLIYWHGFTKQV